MNDLPSEIVDLIIQHVGPRSYYQCALINRSFYSVVTPLLWRNLNITKQESLNNLLTVTLESQPTLGQHIQQARFRDDCEMTDANTIAFIQQTPNLKELWITGQQQLTDTAFQQLETFCPNLESLYAHAPGITQLSIDAIGKLKYLGELELVNCAGLDCRLFSSLTLCPSLTELTLSGCELEDINDPDMTDTALLAISRLNGLINLTIRDDHRNDFGGCLDFVDSWHFLTTLWLHDCPNITDDQVIAFLRTHPYLTDLALFGGNLTDLTLDAIGTHVPDILLMRLVFNWGFTELGVRRLVYRCWHLYDFQLFGTGILAADFPEAGLHLWDVETYEYNAGGPMFLEYLDDDAMVEIRYNYEKQLRIGMGHADD